MAQSFLFENGQLGPSVEVAFNWDDGAAAAGPSSSTEDGATSIAVLERAVRETFGLDDFLAFGIVYAPVARKGLSPVPITTRADVEYCARLQRTLGKRITLSIVDTAELDAALLAIRSRSASPTRSAPASAKRYHVEQWLRLSLEHTLLKIEPGLYRQFMERPPTETDAVLRRDLGRTFPETKMFADSALATDEDGDGKARLFNVLHAVVTRDCERKDHIGVQPMAYVQGMNFVAAHLLRRGATDEEAFWMMVRLFECNHYGVSELYSPGLPRLMTTMLQVEELLDPELASHFVANGFRMNMFIPQWVLTLFANKMDPPALDSVWTLFFEHGWAAIVRSALCVLRVATPRLLQCDFEECARLLTTQIWATPDLDALLRAAGQELAITYTEIREGEIRIRDNMDKAEAARRSGSDSAAAAGAAAGGVKGEAEQGSALATLLQPAEAFGTALKKGIDDARSDYDALDGEKKATIVAAAVGATFLTFGAAGLAIAAVAASSALSKSRR